MVKRKRYGETTVLVFWLYVKANFVRNYTSYRLKIWHECINIAIDVVTEKLLWVLPKRGKKGL